MSESDQQFRFRSSSVEVVRMKQELFALRVLEEAVRKCVEYGSHNIGRYGLSAWTELEHALRKVEEVRYG